MNKNGNFAAGNISDQTALNKIYSLLSGLSQTTDFLSSDTKRSRGKSEGDLEVSRYKVYFTNKTSKSEQIQKIGN